jgi:integrase
MEALRLLSTKVASACSRIAGYRMQVSEALSLQLQDCDVDNLLLTLNGKGAKQRKVPFSFEVRKFMVKYSVEFCPHPHSLLPGTARGSKLEEIVPPAGGRKLELVRGLPEDGLHV